MSRAIESYRIVLRCNVLRIFNKSKSTIFFLEMAAITTYVFLDLEATGLPRKENNQTKITELSLVAVSRKHLLTTPLGKSPRVQHKLTLCFNPERGITAKASEMSGLTNDLLDEESKFSNGTCKLLEAFFAHLNRPICLVSHGGNYLDYPVFKKQLVEGRVVLPADLRYVDSLDVFYCLMEGSSAIGSSFPRGIRLRRSYKLKDVYSRLLKRAAPKAHRAEADCLVVVECAVALSEKFVRWVDAHSNLFSQQKSLGFHF